MQIYWIDSPKPKSLAIVSRPRGGDWLEDEILALRRGGIDIVVSLLTAPEQEELGLIQESSACEKTGIRYLNFPINDRSVPSSHRDFAAFLDQFTEAIARGNAIGVHCRASIGRASLLNAALLCRQGLSPAKVFELLSEARGLKVPDTEEQIKWIEQFTRSPYFKFA